MPSAHGPIFVEKAPRKSRSEGPIFYRSESTHTDRLFTDLRQNIGPILRFFIGMSFGAHGPIFYRSYCA